MSFNIETFINQQFEDYTIEVDEDSILQLNEELASTFIQVEDKSFDALSDEAKEELPFIFEKQEDESNSNDDEDVPSRQARLVPALNLTRCSSMPDMDWVDSFLWIASDAYKVIKPSEQLMISTEFLEFIKTNDDYHTFFYNKLKPKAQLLPWLKMETKEQAVAFLNSSAKVDIVTLVALTFGYALHIFSLKTADFLEPTYISKLRYQNKNRTIFMVLTADMKLEPLFQLSSDFFSQEFTWDEAILCPIKTICNIGPAKSNYTMPSEEECSSLPDGKTVDSIQEWIQTYFPTWIQDEEKPVINDSRSYPIEPLQKLPHYIAAQAKIKSSEWYTAKTVGDGTCLLHSFLQCVSPVYRTLPQESRSLVGQWFRRAVIAPLYKPESLSENDKKNKYKVEDYKISLQKYQQIKRTGAWLEQDDLQKLIDLYKVNVVIINTSSHDLVIYKPESGFKENPYICILCSNEIHFSSIYLKKQDTFMLSEEEMRSEYPEIVGDLYKDDEFDELRKELVGVVRGTEAEDAIKEGIVQNIFKHVRSRIGEPNASPPDKPARALEPTLSTYAERLGVEPTVFNEFRPRLQTITGGRRNKTLKARR